MPTVGRHGPYRLFFYSADRKEPPHVHVERDRSRAKIWLDPVRLQQSSGFAPREIRTIVALVGANAETLLRDWYEFFDDDQ